MYTEYIFTCPNSFHYQHFHSPTMTYPTLRFLLLPLSLCCPAHLGSGANLLGVSYIIKENGRSSLRCLQLLIWWWDLIHLPYPITLWCNSVCLELEQACAWCHNLHESTCAAALWCLKTRSLDVVHDLWLLQSSRLFFHKDPWALEGRSAIRMSHLGLSTLQSFILCMLSSWRPCYSFFFIGGFWFQGIEPIYSNYNK